MTLSPKANQQQIEKMRPVTWIPNVPGFQLIGITRGGTAVLCEVELAQDGGIRLADNMLPYLVGWVDAPGHQWCLAYLTNHATKQEQPQ